jgi:hypothetical protein
MTWDVLAAVAELLGAIGVIASLVYLAGQVRASTKQAVQTATQSKQAALQSVVNKMNDFYNQTAAAGTADLWVRGSRGMATLESETERVQFSSFLMSMFRPYEEIYHYWLNGVADDWLWESTSAPCVAVMGTPGFRDWWEVRSDWFSEQFRNHVTESLDGPAHYRRHN